MCLNVKKRSCVQTAKKDIVVYKHLSRVRLIVDSIRNEDIVSYLTTYRRSEIVIGQTYTSVLEKSDYNKVKVDFGLHSFAEKRPCCIDGMTERANVVVRCTIPKGSKYYVGEFCCEKSYASNCLRYDEIIIDDLKNFNLKNL